MNQFSHFVFRYMQKKRTATQPFFWEEQLRYIQLTQKCLCKRNNVQTLEKTILVVSLSLRNQNELNVMNVLHWKRFPKLCDDGKANGVSAINSFSHTLPIPVAQIYTT